MRRVDKQVTDRAWIDEVLHRAQMIHIAMADRNGQPYIVPMGFGYDDKAIYLHGAAKGLKNDLLAANPKVCFNVSIDLELVRDAVGSEFTMKYRSVTGFGTLVTLESREEKDHALAEIMKAYDGPHAPLGEKHAHIWAARIDIESVAGKISGYPKPEQQ